jgi:hypothetical protein
MNEQEVAIARQAAETAHDARRALANMAGVARGNLAIGDDTNLSQTVLDALRPHAVAILAAADQIETITAALVGKIDLPGYAIGNKISAEFNGEWGHA